MLYSIDALFPGDRAIAGLHQPPPWEATAGTELRLRTSVVPGDITAHQGRWTAVLGATHDEPAGLSVLRLADAYGQQSVRTLTGRQTVPVRTDARIALDSLPPGGPDSQLAAWAEEDSGTTRGAGRILDAGDLARLHARAASSLGSRSAGHPLLALSVTAPGADYAVASAQQQDGRPRNSLMLPAAAYEGLSYQDALSLLADAARLLAAPPAGPGAAGRFCLAGEAAAWLEKEWRGTRFAYHEQAKMLLEDAIAEGIICGPRAVSAGVECCTDREGAPDCWRMVLAAAGTALIAEPHQDGKAPGGMTVMAAAIGYLNDLLARAHRLGIVPVPPSSAGTAAGGQEPAGD